MVRRVMHGPVLAVPAFPPCLRIRFNHSVEARSRVWYKITGIYLESLLGLFIDRAELLSGIRSSGCLVYVLHGARKM